MSVDLKLGVPVKVGPSKKAKDLDLVALAREFGVNLGPTHENKTVISRFGPLLVRGMVVSIPDQTHQVVKSPKWDHKLGKYSPTETENRRLLTVDINGEQFVLRLSERMARDLDTMLSEDQEILLLSDSFTNTDGETVEYLKFEQVES